MANDETATDRDARFAAGVRSAIAAILVNPNFILRAESAEPAAALATRLSMFLWGGLPDEALVRAARTGRLNDPQRRGVEVRRMLADPKADRMLRDFADQWLHLRNLRGFTPDLRRFPDFDENLRRSMIEETLHLFREVATDDVPVTDLIRPDYVFLDERLATHYGIANIRGPEMRKVPHHRLGDTMGGAAGDIIGDTTDGGSGIRGGLLRNASILAVTSYATRTSPTIRGAWVLENLFATPPPPPPPNIPDLTDNDAVVVAHTIRQRLRLHRDDAACAACHDLIDPVGFALERYDAVGRWRSFDGDAAIDARGRLPSGGDIHSLADLEQSLIDHPDWFAHCVTEKLLTYAMGRLVDHRDGPAVRRIVRDAADGGYRFSDLVVGVVQTPQMSDIGFGKSSPPTTRQIHDED